MIGFLAPNDGNIPLPKVLTGPSIMANSGNNTGNLAFFYMGCRLVEGDVTHITHSDPRLKDCRAIIIPAANWIGSHTDIQFLATALEDVTCPILVLGLGAQSEREDIYPQIPDGTKAFINLLERKRAAVTVRGSYSAKVLTHYGLTNINVLGCPSLLTSAARDLGKRVERKISNLTVENVLVSGAGFKGSLASVERELYRIVRYQRGSSYLVQRPSEFVSVITREELNDKEEAYIQKFSEFLGVAGGRAELKSFLLECGHVPVGIEGWSAFAQRFSCALNTRIHGTMVAFQAEVPSLCIAHDTRTHELSSQCRLPMINVKQFIENRHDLKGLFDLASFDGASFDENRQQIAARYISIIRHIGLQPSKHLQSLAA